MGQSVEFKFSLDEKVVTPFGDSGIITMRGEDDGGVQYAVKTKNAHNWYKEKELSAEN